MTRTRGTLVAALAVLAAAAGCQREERNFRPPEPFARRTAFYPQYQRNAYSLAEGKQLYTRFNCVGCHAWGGGGMGPALMDSEWLYGAEPDEVYASISEGRPGGMPAFGGKVPPYEIWRLVGYVRSLSGLAPKDAAPGRNDDIKSAPAENSRDTKMPVRNPPPTEGSQ